MRWYCRHILPRLVGSPVGRLFVTEMGAAKTQATLSQQIIERIVAHVGIRITPHQFRHIATALYLESRPEDFATVQALLGHASAKTTLIYAGNSSRRASRALADFVNERCDAMKLRRRRRGKRR